MFQNHPMSGKPVGAEDDTARKGPGFITRYFLRRLAMARRERPGRDGSVAHTEAKVEAILLVIACPVIALMSIIVFGSFHWLTPADLRKVHISVALKLGKRMAPLTADN